MADYPYLAEVEKETFALLMKGDNLGSGGGRDLEILGPKGEVMASDWMRVPAADDQPLSFVDMAKIYVMNSHGKTIAIYSL